MQKGELRMMNDEKGSKPRFILPHSSFILTSASSAYLLEPLLKLRLQASIRRLVIDLRHAEVILLNVSALVVVSILIAFAMSKLFRALVVGIAQMFGDGEGTAFFNV